MTTANAIKDPTNLGNVLLTMGVLTVDKLKDAVLTQIDMRGEQHLGAILIAMGIINETDLEFALKVQKSMRADDPLSAHMTVLEYQSQRIDRSVDRQQLAMDRAERALGLEDVKAS